MWYKSAFNLCDYSVNLSLPNELFILKTGPSWFCSLLYVHLLAQYLNNTLFGEGERREGRKGRM